MNAKRFFKTLLLVCLLYAILYGVFCGVKVIMTVLDEKTLKIIGRVLLVIVVILVTTFILGNDEESMTDL